MGSKKKTGHQYPNWGGGLFGKKPGEADLHRKNNFLYILTAKLCVVNNQSF